MGSLAESLKCVGIKQMSVKNEKLVSNMQEYTSDI